MSGSPPALLQVVTTAPTKHDALRMAGILVEERLAACSQVSGPVVSRYWWEGKVEEAEEWYCVLKSTPERYPDLARRIRSLHSYQNPEIVALPVTRSSPDYADWIQSVLPVRAGPSAGPADTEKP